MTRSSLPRARAGLLTATLLAAGLVALAAPATADYPVAPGTWDLTFTIGSTEIPLTQRTDPDLYVGAIFLGWRTGVDAAPLEPTTAPATVTLTAWFVRDGAATAPSQLSLVILRTSDGLGYDWVRTIGADPASPHTVSFILDEPGHYQLGFSGGSTIDDPYRHTFGMSPRALEVEEGATLPGQDVPGKGDDKRSDKATAALAARCDRGAAGTHAKHCR